MSWKNFTTRNRRRPVYAFGKKVQPVTVVKAKRKRRRAKTYTTRVPISLGNPLAQRTLVWLRYHQSGILASSGAGLPGQQIFRLNSIFDPDLSGVGHQPYGHDTYQQIYNRYRVHKVRYRVVLTTASTIANIGVVVLNNLTASSINSAVEQTNRAQFDVLGPNGHSTAIYKGTIDLATLNGATAAEYGSDDRFGAQFGANPVENMGLQIIVENDFGGTSTIYWAIKIEYYTELHDPIPLSQS